MLALTTPSLRSVFLIITTFCFGFIRCSDTVNEENRDNTTDSFEWHQAVTYEVFVHAFADETGDGIGDFRGLTSKLQ
ncbi:MAG: hypothetical protein WD604_08905 [Balneolaceae bacterium]